jgi:hypothetical protein
VSEEKDEEGFLAELVVVVFEEVATILHGPAPIRTIAKSEGSKMVLSRLVFFNIRSSVTAMFELSDLRIASHLKSF